MPTDAMCSRTKLRTGFGKRSDSPPCQLDYMGPGHQDAGPHGLRGRGRIATMRTMSLLGEPGVYPLRQVAVFAEAPDLLRALSANAVAELMSVRTPLVSLDRGAWRPPTPRTQAQCHFGFLVSG